MLSAISPGAGEGAYRRTRGGYRVGHHRPSGRVSLGPAHAGPQPTARKKLLAESGGPPLDVGPYPVSLMLDWFGPVEEVQGMFDIMIPERTGLDGRQFKVTKFEQGAALPRFVGGVIGRIAFSYANINTDHPGLEIQGTPGRDSEDPPCFKAA